jgi:hypothetical protein
VLLLFIAGNDFAGAKKLNPFSSSSWEADEDDEMLQRCMWQRDDIKHQMSE